MMKRKIPTLLKNIAAAVLTASVMMSLLPGDTLQVFAAEVKSTAGEEDDESAGGDSDGTEDTENTESSEDSGDEDSSGEDSGDALLTLASAADRDLSGYTTLHISDEDELARFMNNCVSDSYSENLIVELDDDISMTNGKFVPAQIFAGVFHGNGHTVSNVYHVGDGYADGFFRYVTPEAYVDGLTVYGHFEAENDKIMTGGIAGVNAGVISECTFTGIISGKTETGGIAGENETTGVIYKSESFGSITGYNMAGGIAGENYGAIVSCTNRSGVDADSSWVDETDSQGYEWIKDTIEEQKLVSGTDIGGIAGLSHGIILNCTNSGNVGYNHNGYNVGGIAGRQSGRINYCTNEGEVYGRKDVGGIVGQMEPYISIEDAESISEAAQILHDMVDVFLDDAGDTSDDITADLDSLRGFSDQALDSAHSISDSVTSFVDSNVAAGNEVMNRVDYLSDQMPGILSDTSDAVAKLKLTAKDLRKVADIMNIYDDMEDTDYHDSVNPRLCVYDSVGGTSTVSPESPDAGTTVTITMTPDAGYKVDGDPVISGSSDVPLTKTSEDGTTPVTYTFTMPEDNITVSCQYTRLGSDESGYAAADIYVVSGPGGDASCEEIKDDSGNSTGKYQITVTPDKYHKVSAVSAEDSAGTKITADQSETDTTKYTVDISGAKTASTTPVKVSITFAQKSDADVVNDSNASMSDKVDKLNDETAAIQNTLDNLEGETPTADEAKTLVKEIGEATVTISEILSDLSTASSVEAPYIEEALKEADVQLNVVMGDLEVAFSYLKDALNKTGSAFSYINSLGDVGFTKLDSSVSGNISSLFGSMDSISGAAGSLTDNLADNSDILEDDLHDINDQVNRIIQLFSSMVDDAQDIYNDESLYEDVSDEMIDTVTDGKVDTCTNKGNITGDIDVGGIAGSMAVDEEDPEGSAAGDVSYTLGARYLTKCIITGCVNRADVTGKKDGIGGIAGYMNLGIISGSDSIGHIQSTEGSYVGGISGQSLALIRDCDAETLLSGSEYVGGIAGSGCRIDSCCSITQISGDCSQKGAIAGRIEKDDDERFDYGDDVKDNYFTSETLGAIDGMSMEGKGERVSYEKLTARDDIPVDFRHLTVTYIADGEKVDTQEVKYGTDLENVDMPEVPERNDSTFGVWPDMSGQTMEVNLTLEAEYEDNITTLTGETTVNDYDGESVLPKDKAYVLIDGVYTDAADLQVDITEENGSVIYAVNLKGTGITDSDISKVRLYNPYEEVKAVEIKNEKDKWKDVDYKGYGTYVQVEMQGTSAVYRVSGSEKTNYVPYYAAGGCGAALLLILIIARKRIHKKRTRKKHTQS